jgi:uroporphyrinogen-III synthase
MPFDGLKVLALESRRAAEIAELIRRQGGDPFVAPSIREAPLESREEAFAFAERLFGGGFDMMILTTGVGTRALDRLLATRYPQGAFTEALRRITVVARGSKTTAALREMGVPVTVVVREPNTWREILTAVDNRPERRIAVQEYGRPNEELLAALRARGAQVTPVRVYQYELPEDTRPLEAAARGLAGDEFDVALFTTGFQIVHLLRIAASLGIEADVRRALARTMIGSIGPATNEALVEYGVEPDMMPSQAKMGFLLKEAAEQAAAVLRKKRT